MKNRLVKIWGIVLVLAVLAGMLIPAMPASAAVIDMTWSLQGAPAAVPFNVLTPAAGGSAWLWDISVDGKVQFAWNNNTSTLYKSTNGGVTLTSGAATATATSQSLAVFDVVPAAGSIITLKVSRDYAADQTVILATSTVLYRSSNGGATFSSFATAGGATSSFVGSITSVDVGPDFRGGQAIVVGTTTLAASGKAYRYTASNPIWTDLGFAAADIYGVSLSPNYRNDAEVLVVAVNATGTYLWTKVGITAAVNDQVLPATITAALTTASAGIATTKVNFAFPFDYNWSGANYTFVAIGNGAGGIPAGNDVYRIMGALPGGTSLTADLNVSGNPSDSNVNDIAFKGNLADGWLYIGMQSSTTIWRATGASASVLTFVPSTKSPTGPGANSNTMVGVSNDPKDTNVWAITSGLGGALQVSTDTAQNFNLISLIQVSSSFNFKFIDLAVIDANTMFLLAWDDSGVTPSAYDAGERTFLFKTADGGGSWQGIFVTSTYMTKIYPSPAYAAATPDNTLYIIEGNNTGRIWKSSNAGVNFVGYSAGIITNITAFTAVDASTYYVAGANAVSKGGFANPATISNEIPTSIAYVSATDMFVGTQGGSVYRSLDGGNSFFPIGSPRVLATPVNVLMVDAGYATNKTIYAGLTPGGIWRWTIDTSATWTQILSSIPYSFTAGVGPQTTVNVTSMSQVADGTVYVSTNSITPTGVIDNAGTIMRCTTPTAPVTTWDRMAIQISAAPARVAGLAGFPAANTGPQTITVKAAATGTAQVPNNTVYVVVQTTINTSVAPAPDNRGSSLYAVKDTVVAAPAVTTPAAGAQVAMNANFTWIPVTTGYAPVYYDFQIAYDAGFSNTIVNASYASPSASTTGIAGTIWNPTGTTGVSPLQPGQSYFWRVRVGNQTPLASKWSATTAFSVMLSNTNFDLSGTAGLSLQPSAGDTNVPLKPVFQWANVTGAMSYDLQLADNPVFVNPMDAQTGLNTNVWTYTKTLENSKTYYWRVRAVSASNVASAWVASAFTTVDKTTATGGPAPVVPTITVSVPPAVAPVVTVNVPTQAAPVVTVTALPAKSEAQSTPASIWVLIVIGAILIIAVIVLIVRTKKQI